MACVCALVWCVLSVVYVSGCGSSHVCVCACVHLVDMYGHVSICMHVNVHMGGCVIAWICIFMCVLCESMYVFLCVCMDRYVSGQQESG